VIQATTEDIASFRADKEWNEPFVRVHFLATLNAEDMEIEEVVDAPNTSTQVKRFTLEEYAGRFEELKATLVKAKFDVSHITFRENEGKDWQGLEIIQRLSCFLKGLRTGWRSWELDATGREAAGGGDSLKPIQAGSVGFSDLIGD
jgi:hypothetical protein